MIIFKEEPKRYIRTKDGRITTLKDKLIDSIDLWVSGGKKKWYRVEVGKVNEDSFEFSDYDMKYVHEIPLNRKDLYKEINKQ